MCASRIARAVTPSMVKRNIKLVLDNWNSPVTVLMLTAIGMQLSFLTWWTLSKNFAVEEIAFTGREIGIQESVREIPGFLAFLVVYVTLIIREQKLAILEQVDSLLKFHCPCLNCDFLSAT